MAGRFRTRSSGIALAGLWVAALTGCGGSHDDTVRDLAREFHEALAASDGAAACGLLVPATRRELEESSGKDCAQAILEEQIPLVTGDGETAVFETMAQVEYAHDTVFLPRLPDGWRVFAAGCAPRADGPYDCAVKGA